MKKLTPNNRLALILIGIMLISCAVTAAAVPLYRLFCQQLGIPVPSILVGQHASIAPATPISDRTVTIRFVANSASGVPIRFNPVSYSIKAHLGEPVLTAYDANNTSPAPLDGVAVHMLYYMGGPHGVQINQYVELQQCFCFELQHYPGSSTVKLPLSFTISPDLPEGIHTITFSYTLFEALPNDARIRPAKTTSGTTP